MAIIAVSSIECNGAQNDAIFFSGYSLGGQGRI